MDWAEIVQTTGQLIRAAQADFLTSQETQVAAQAGAARRAVAQGARAAEREKHRLRVARISELHAARERLLIAPPGTPGVQGALKSVEALLRKLQKS